MNKRTFNLIVLLLVTTATVAQPKVGYYTTDLNGKNGRKLELALQAIIYPHTALSYNDLWKAYETTDPGPADSIPSGDKTDLVYDMYAWMKDYPKFYSDNNHTQTGGFNREHALPNSWWGGKAGNAEAYTDLHHLTPADGAANNAKQNYPLGEDISGMTLSWPTTTTTYYSSTNPATHVWNTGSQSSYYGGAAKVFEPADQYKGDFARMYLYVICAYEGKLTWKFNYMFTNDGTTNNYTNINANALALLLKWHLADPVSEKEKARNNAVESLQGNRNPFIDYPTLVEYIWGNNSSKTDFDISTATSSYETSTQLSPTAKWMLNGKQVASVEAKYASPFTCPTLHVTLAEGTTQGTITYSSSDESIATINSDGQVTINDKLGTTTITATVPATETSGDTAVPSGSASYILTITKTNLVGIYLQETFDTNDGTGGNDGKWNGNIATSSANFDLNVWGSANTRGANKCIRVGLGTNGGSVSTPDIDFSGTAYLSFKAGAWNGNDEGTTLKIYTTSGTLSQSTVTMEKGAWTDYILKITDATSPVSIGFESGNDKSYNRFFLDEVIVGKPTTISSVKYATFGLPYAVKIPDGITAYTATVSGNIVTLHQITNSDNSIPASTGVILYGNPGDYLFLPTNTTATITDNKFLPTLGTPFTCTEADNGLIYYLGSDGDKASFFKLAQGGTIPTYKAYLKLDAALSSAKLDVSINDDPSGIEDVNAKANANAIYNLNGVRVNSNYKGIIIVNGKKYFSK